VRKYTFSIAFLALTAFLAFLSACGEGEPMNLEQNSVEWGNIMNAITDLTGEDGLIIKCAKGVEPDGKHCATIDPQSSNSEAPVPSSNSNNSDNESSSSAGSKSSSSTATNSSSSSSGNKSSSSAANNVSSNSGGGGGGNVVTVTSTKQEITSSKTQYSCVFVANGGDGFFCKAKNCPSSGTAFKITVGDKEQDMNCYNSGDSGENHRIGGSTETSLCDPVGTSTPTVRSISIPAGKTVECSIGYN